MNGKGVTHAQLNFMNKPLSPFPHPTPLSSAYIFNTCSFTLHSQKKESHLKQLPCTLTIQCWRKPKSLSYVNFAAELLRAG